jgi:hypothetical protein
MPIAKNYASEFNLQADSITDFPNALGLEYVDKHLKLTSKTIYVELELAN